MKLSYKIDVVETVNPPVYGRVFPYLVILRVDYELA